MDNPSSLAAAERILKDLEAETMRRIESNKASTESPQMNSAVGRLTYIDA